MHRFDETLWEALARDEPSLAQLVARSFTGEREDQLTVSVVLGDLHQVHELLLSAGHGRISQELVRNRVTAILVHDDRESYTVGLWDVAKNVTLLTGVPPFTDDRWRRVERWAASLEPRVVGVFLDEGDFEGLCEGLARVARVEVSRLTARVLSDGSSYTRGWPEDRVFARPSFQEALNEVASFALVRSLTLHVGDRLSLHLRRVAGATYYSGDFDLFEEIVIKGLAEAAGRRETLLANRARSASSPVETALSINLPSPVLGDFETQSELLTFLTSQKGLGLAVLHRNPYLHVAVTDYLDGSNFDIFVVSESQLTIFPGYWATVGSLARTADAISDRFAAVAISEVPAARPPTREELFTTG
jgi:hypothetical protein